MSKIIVGEVEPRSDSARLKRTSTGKYRIVPGTVTGREYVVRRSIAIFNGGRHTFVTAGGERLPIRVIATESDES